MKKILRWLAPKENGFFELLKEQSENALQGAKELKIFIDDYSSLERGERKARAYAIKKIEHKGDEISKRIFEKLNKNFRTPVNKEHVNEITILLDDMTDLIDAVASMFVVLSIERIENPITKMAGKVHSSVDEVNKSIMALRKLKGMEGHYLKIRELEKDADEIYSDALSELFHFYKSPIDIIKYKEIYELLEKIMDKCKDIADVIESVAARHS